MSSDKNNLLISSLNPATKEIIQKVRITPQKEIERMVNRAWEFFPAWRDIGLNGRVEILSKAQQLLLERSEEFAHLITQEMGRPYVESLALEVQAAVDLIGYYVKKAKKFLEDRSFPIHNLLLKRRKSLIHFEPLGVFGVISPWNWPLLIPLGFIVPALFAGNAVVHKHSEITPLINIQILQLFLDAGVPDGIFQIIQGYAPAGRALVDSSVEKIFFTGSTDVGQKVMRQAARSLKKVVLEMGGSDPAIVCADVDLDNCSSGILWGGFNNCGQNCNAIERIFLNKNISDQFISLLLEKMSKLRIGNGKDLNTDIGPLATEMQLAKMVGVVTEAVEKGGQILTGGNVIDKKGGYFFEPTVILWNKELPLPSNEEIFGPIIHIIPVSDDEEAIKLANQSIYGLAASVWTTDIKKGQEIGKRIESGSVMVNDSVVSFGIVEANWTGIKKSGIGWVHGEKGLDEMVNIKYICSDSQFHQQKFWWFPYGKKMIIAIKEAIIFLFSNKIIKRLFATPRTLKHFLSYLILNRKRKDKL